MTCGSWAYRRAARRTPTGPVGRGGRGGGPRALPHAPWCERRARRGGAGTPDGGGVGERTLRPRCRRLPRAPADPPRRLPLGSRRSA
eukprot:6115155-Lingulodinium_polyedra.AAC.1